MTNTLLLQTAVLPLYGQVAIQDPTAVDIPDWDTGKEQAVASPQVILVATQPDSEGDVSVVVVQGSEADGIGECVYEGELALTDSRLAVGSAVGSQLSEVNLSPRRTVAVRIFVDPPQAPRRVTVLVPA